MIWVTVNAAKHCQKPAVKYVVSMTCCEEGEHTALGTVVCLNNGVGENLL